MNECADDVIKVINSDDTENGLTSQEDKETRKGQRCWNEKQTRLLLSLYKQNCNKLDDGMITNRKFWATIVEGLKNGGYSFTSVQCSTKMDTLKRIYKKVKDHNASSGNTRRTCDYYDLLDELFHKKPWIKPLSTAGSNIPMTDMDQSDENVENKRRKLSTNINRSEYLRQCLENQRMRSDATIAYRQEKLKLLKNLTDKFKSHE